MWGGWRPARPPAPWPWRGRSFSPRRLRQLLSS
uniref:Uncharacterized protein n=1 Tax=Arundo donax TaxID=35708 RepID=A0A0A8Z777_ARUDO